MSDYHMHEGALDLPDHFSDATLNAVTCPLPEGELNVFVARIPAAKKPLRELVAKRLVDMRRALSQFELLDQQDLVVDGEPAVALVVTLRDGKLKKVQRLLNLIVRDKLVTIGVNAAIEARRDVDVVFERAVATLVVRRAEAA